jgi:outer membrane protein, heavy metal efflux system
MSRHPLRMAAWTILLLLGGCATVPREAGFTDVQRLVADRGVMRIHWNQGTAEDQAVADAVDALLSRPLSADEAVQIALLNNRRLQATYADLMVAQAELVQAGLLANPVFEGEFKIHEGTGDLAFEGSVVQDFIDIFQIPLRKRIAAGAFETAKLTVAGEVLDLALRTRMAYYRLQADQQMLELRQTVLEALEASYAVAQELRRAGNITELALLQERTQYEQAKIGLADAEAAMLADREQLAALMGLWGMQTQWTLSNRLPDPPEEEVELDAVERRAIASSLELAAYRHRINTAGRRLRLTRPFAWFPEGEAGVAAEHSSEEGWAIGPALSLPIPLFDQGQGRIATAAAQLQQARERYAAAAVDIRADARAATLRLRAARERVLYYRNVILPLRQALLEQAQLQYNAMQIGVFELLRARQQQVNAASDYIDSLRQYWIARANVQAVAAGQRIGSPDGGDTAGPGTVPIDAGDAGGH